MINTKHGRLTSILWRGLGISLLSLPMAANAVEINNGVPEGTVGHYRVDVLAGGETRTAFVTAARFFSNDITTTDVIFDYSSLVDPGNDGTGFSLSNSDPVDDPFVDPVNPNMVTSSGTFLGVNQNVISWMAVSSIAPGAQVMTTTYTFTTATGTLGPLRFLQYLDEDVQGASSDVFFTTGTAASGNLELFTFDNTEVFGLSHSGVLLPGTGLQNAGFAGWAADRFNNMRPRITGSGQPVDPTVGVIANLLPFQHPQLGPVFGPADIVSVLAWDVDPNATTAVITTSLGGEPISQQTVETRPVGNLARCGSTRCTIQAACIIPPSPGAVCTNRARITVSGNALRASDDTSAKARRVRFAAGVANIPPGETRLLRLKLTSRGRSFVRSTTKRRIRGVMQITNAAGTTVSPTPIVLRIRK